MKKAFICIMLIATLPIFAACGKMDEQNVSSIEPTGTPLPTISDEINVAHESIKPQPSERIDESAGENSTMTNITVTVGASVFSAVFYDSAAVKTLLKQFPMTLDMSDLNANEKYCSLAESLSSTTTESPATIHAGEVMCWSGNSFVLFYKTFANSYGGYIRLGYIEDVSGLADALGKGAVQVTFAVSE